MSSTFSSRTYNFNTLLGRSSFPDYTTKIVEVPRFQRGYSWEKKHVAMFWEDIWDFHNKASSKETYFLGPIVILPGKDSIGVLDGQQRLATATILLAAIRDLARQKGGSKGADLARDIQRDNILVDEDEEGFSLIPCIYDRDYFENHIQTDPPEGDRPAKIRSHRLILQAANFLKKVLKEEFSEMSSKELVKELKRFKTTIVERLKIVVIDVESEEEAYQIFETLNDRGLRLSTPDLLLNYLMQAASSEEERSKVHRYWGVVIDTVGTNKVSTFLRHMWVSKYGDVKSQGLYREIRYKFKESGEGSAAFARECSKEAEAYSSILKVNEVKLRSASKNVRALVKNLGADKTYPALLSGFQCLNDNDFEKLSRYLIAIIVRHSLIANLNPSTLEDALYDVARSIRESVSLKESSAKSLSGAKKILKKIDPTREQIRLGLKDFYLDNKSAQYILKEIANNMQSKTKVVSLEKASLEHIFPQNWNDEEWNEADDLEDLIWHIGNLTFLEPRINRNIGNSGFKEKVKSYKESEIVMTKDLALLGEDWSRMSVIKRAESFCKYVEEVWKIN